MPLASDVLSRLFHRGDRAALATSSRAVQVWPSKDCPAYWAMPLDERDAFHAELERAERSGAVELGWSRQGGENRTIDRVRLLDLHALARFLAISTTASEVDAAAAVLAPWRQAFPRVGDILARWAARKKVRGLGPSSAADFADALRIVQALQARGLEDQVVRRLSVELFRDSKRIEELDRHLDVLTAESLASSARGWEEVFRAVGLVKEPQPFLLAGSGQLHLANGETCPLARPFVGVANRAVTGYTGNPRWILTVENLTTFHLCSQEADAALGLILFTGGMPSPSWCRAFCAVLADVNLRTPVFHWGDIDTGGFRIAARLRECVDPGRAFRPWLMVAGDLPLGAEATVTDNATGTAMRRHAERAGWSDIVDRIGDVRVEQEVIPVRLPSVTGAN